MIIWPWPSLLAPQSEMWRPDPRPYQGQATLQGDEQVVYSGLSRWTARITLPVYSRDTIRAARALDWRLMGGINAVMVGPCDMLNAAEIAPRIGGITHSDGTTHSDGAGYSQGGVPSTVFEAAAQHTTTLVIAAGSVRGLTEGVYLGLGTGDARRIYGVIDVAAGPAPETYALTITPRLRAAVSVGAVIDWTYPRCPMRCETGGLPLEVQLARYGQAQATLYEVWE